MVFERLLLHGREAVKGLVIVREPHAVVDAKVQAEVLFKRFLNVTDFHFPGDLKVRRLEVVDRQVEHVLQGHESAPWFYGYLKPRDYETTYRVAVNQNVGNSKHNSQAPCTIRPRSRDHRTEL